MDTSNFDYAIEQFPDDMFEIEGNDSAAILFSREEFHEAEQYLTENEMLFYVNRVITPDPDIRPVQGASKSHLSPSVRDAKMIHCKKTV